MLKDGIDLGSVKRILVIKLRHHGDVLLSSPVISILKNHAPHVEVDVLVYRDTQDMLLDHPSLSQLHAIDRNWKKSGLLKQIFFEFNLFFKLKNRKYDLIIHLTNHNRGAWLSRLLRPKWSVAATANYSRWFRKSFTHSQELVPGCRRHAVEINIDALRRLGVQPFPDEKELVLIAGGKAESSANEKLKCLDLKDKEYILIHPTSRWMFKAWPVDNFVELIDLLVAAGHKVLLTSAPDKNELNFVEEIKTKLKIDVPSLAGELSLKELAALISRAKMVFGVDSVPMHMSSALKTPVVALFGPTFDSEWGPWRVKHRVISSRMSCRPCGRAGCGGGRVSECLTLISAEQVFAEIKNLLEECK